MPPSPPLHDRRYRPVDPSALLGPLASELHAAFAAERHRPDMWRCPHCVTAGDVERLGAPVTTLEPDLVGRFVVKAGTTWGTAADLRRVAPRALVLAAEGRLPVDRVLVWDQFRRAGWPGWPEQERAAVLAFLAGEWGRLLRSPPRPAHAAHAWLRHVAVLTDDLGPFLDAWHDALGALTPRPHQRAAVGHLVVLLTASALRPDLPRTVADLFPREGPGAAQLTAWLTGPATALELQRASAALADTPEARRTAIAAERLRRFRAAVAAPRP